MATATSRATTGSERADLRPTVLVVDDNPMDRRWAAGIAEKRAGLRAISAADGAEALAILDRDAPGVVLTDLHMPEMDGLELVEALRDRHPRVPVVLMTAHGSEEIALKALQRGAASYVTKRNLAEDLAETLHRVLASARAETHQHRLHDGLVRVELHYALENDPALVSALVLRLHEALAPLRLCDENGALRVDVALHEALLNGLYHGNLEVGSELRLDGEAAYHGLAERRRHLPPYRDRLLHVHARLSRAEAVFTIRDEGPGFDPSALPDPNDPANLDRPSGRGMLLIRTFMDEVAFNPTGNQITMTKRRPGGAGASPF